MGNINALFTFDYEIFGNGSGDIKNCLVTPTDNIAKLLGKYSLPATFFVDVCLIWAVEENEKKGAFNHLNYSPTELLKDQLKNLVESGHDVQLHAHPQMMGSHYSENIFSVNYDYWRISDLPLGKSESDLLTIHGILAQGKKTLQDIIQNNGDGYHCLAFRAGGLCSRPEENFFKAMRRTGFTLDFSGAHDFKIEDWPGAVDFTDVFDKSDPLLVGESYNQQTEQNPIISIPIYGAKFYPWSDLPKRIWNKFFQGGTYWTWKKKRPTDCQGSTEVAGSKRRPEKKTKRKRFNKLNMHFYLENSLNSMIWCTKHAIRKARLRKKDVYLVGIGHPKAMGDLSQLEKYLEWVTNKSGKNIIKFYTVSQISEQNFSPYFNQ
jgi:hypothetical protein